MGVMSIVKDVHLWEFSLDPSLRAYPLLLSHIAGSDTWKGRARNISVYVVPRYHHQGREEKRVLLRGM
jgi:hypothetical protein